MASTNLTVFASAVAHNLRDLVLAPIADYITSRGHEVSVDELGLIFDLPASPAAVNLAPIATNVNFLLPAGSNTASGATGPVGPTVGQSATVSAPRRARTTEAPAAGRSCPYVFKRGKGRDTACGKPCVPGAEGCTSHRASLEKTGAPVAHTAAPGVAPGGGNIPGMAGLPPGYAAAIPPANGEPGELSVVEFDSARGLFRDPNHDFIVYEHGNGSVAVVGRWNKSDGQIVALNAAERQLAQSLGLLIADAPMPSSNAPASPSFLSDPAGLPIIVPLGAGPSTSTSSVPQVPMGVPQVPIHSVPSVPQVPAVPQVPMMPPPMASSVAMPSFLPQASALGIPQIPMA